MTAQLTKTSLIDQAFFEFVNHQVLAELGIDSEPFWQNFANLLGDFSPINRQLLEKRTELATRLGDWQASHPSVQADIKSCNGFLKEIGYLADEGPDFTIKTQGVDQEIAHQAGPQLQVAATQARFALKATNARWGSLFDALYDSDLIAQTAGLKVSKKHNQARANRVIRFAKEFLDETFALDSGSHQDVTSYLVYYQHLLAMFADGSTVGLRNPAQFVALSGHKEQPDNIVLKNNGLHVVLELNRNAQVGCRDLAGLNDIQLEAALTTVIDFADSQQTTAEKIEGYQNWLGLMQGSLHAKFDKNGEPVDRTLLRDKRFTCKDGEDYPLPGRTLLIARRAELQNTCSLMQDQDGNNLPENIIDTVMTTLIAMLDRRHNSRNGNIYIVAPHLQGPEEVKYTCQLFAAVEQMLGLARNTLKLGLSNDSPRTTVNLKECIRMADERLFLLDNELTRVTASGPQNLMADWNVDMGLACGLSGKAQIATGPRLDRQAMTTLLAQRLGPVQSGVNCAQVPCPSAAVLHAMHYHKVDVFKVQQQRHQSHIDPSEQVQTLPLLDR